MGEGFRVLADDALPGRFGLLEGLEPFVLIPKPAHQVGVDAGEEAIQRGAVERSVILHPTTHDRVYPSRDAGKCMAGLALQPPAVHLSADLAEGVLADRRHERGERLGLALVAGR